MSDENPYLELAKDIPDQNTTEDSSDNPYMELAANLDTMHDQNLKGSTFVAADKDPDQHAKVLTLAEKFGSRSDFIEENYDIVRKQNEKNLLDEQAFASGPKLKSFIANPDNMAVSKDDLDILNKIEGTVDNHSLANDAWKALQVGGLNLNSMLAKTPGYLANALLIPENIYHKYNNEPQRYFKIENDLSKRYDDAAANLSAQIPDLNKSAFEQLGNADFKGAAKTAMLQFVSNAPVQMGLIASMMTGVGEAGLVAAGVTAAAAKGDALQKQGVEPLQGTAVAGVNGLIEASFESIGTMGLLKSWEQSAIKNFGKQGGKEFVLNFGKQLFHTTFGEGTEEAATSFAQDFVDYSTGVNPDAMKGSIERSFNAGLIGGLSGGLMTSPSGFGLSVAKSRQLYQIKQTQAFYEDLGKFATDSKLRVRAPEKFRELVARLTKDGPVEKTYIDQKGFNEYFQSKNINPTEAAIELGITEQYNDSVETGADIEVPTAIMAEKFAPSEHYQGLADHIKFSPDALTKAQYDTAEAEFANNVKQEYDAAMATKSEDEVKTFEESAKEVAKNVEQQLVTNVKDKSKDAKDKATLISEFFKVMAAKNNQMPMDLFNKYGLKINQLNADMQGMDIKEPVPSIVDLFSQPLPKQNMIPATKDESGNLVLDAANLDALRSRIDQAEAGKIIPKLNDAGEVVGNVAQESTFPEFFKNKGYTKKETLNAIDKYKSGKKLTEKQSLLLEDLYNSMADAANRNEYFQNDNNSLFVHHNLSESKLLFADKMGGLAAPSLAISDKSNELQDFGEITLIARKDLLNDKSMKTFDADVYSPRYPKVSFDLDQKNHRKYNELTKDARMITENSSYFNEDELSRTGKNGLFKDVALQYKFLKDNNINPKLAYDAISKKELSSLKRSGFEKYFGTEKYNLVDDLEFRNLVTESFKKDMGNNPDFKEMIQGFDDNTNGFAGRVISDYASNVSKALSKKIDYYATKRSIEKQIKEKKSLLSKYNTYVDKVYADLNISESIPKETRSGELKYIPHTLNNVVREMTRKIQDGEGFSYNAGNVRAKLAKEFKSINQIKNDRNRLVSKETMDKLKDETNNELYSLSERASKYSKIEGRFGFGDIFTEHLKELIDSNIEKINKEYYNNSLPQDLQKDIVDFLDKLKNMETHYFEIKAQRSVDLSEFSHAIIPKDANKKVIDILKKNNISYKTYDDVNVTRNEALNSIINKSKDSILFQQAKGSITFGNDRQFNINLFKGKDESTFLHETGHFFLEVFADIAQSEGADAQTKQDYDTLLKWFGVNSRSEITTEHHEKFARGFESYLYKGEAPNEKLKNIFRKFANWLKLVYKNVAELNVEVSPEMKEVFDRMLAADEQVDKAYAEMEPIQLFADPKSVGMTDAEALEYLNAVEFAKQEAKETLTAQLMKDILRKAESAYKKKYNELYDSEMKKAESMNEFKTIKAIQAEYKLSKPVLERDYEVFKNYLPRGSTQQEGGMHPDMVAGLYGYENGQAMLQAIAPFRKGIEDYVTTNVADTMKSLYPELLTSPELSNEAIKAAHNDNYKKLKRMELDYLFKNDPKVVSTLGAKLIRRMPTDKMIRAVVEKTVGKTKVKDINPRLFKSAERKYALEASKAFKKGEYDLAIEAKRKEYLNSELYRATEKSKEEIEKTVDKFDKIFKSDEAVAKSRDMDLVSAARYIWSTYGLASDKDQEKTATYLDKLKQYQPDLYKRIEPLLVEYTKNKGSYEEMSYDSFIELSKNVQNIWDMSKTSNEIMIEGKAVLKETIVNELIDRSNTLSEGKEMPGYNKAITDGERRGINILGLLARYKKIEHWAYSFDGGALNGPATKYIFRPISEAQTKFELAKIDVTKKLEKIATDYLKNIDNKKSYSAPEIGYTFKNKQELLYAILHTGNESNYEKLLIGGRGNENPWGYLNADETLNDSQFKGMIDRMIREGSLTRDDFMFAQSIWDLNEQLKPDAQKAHKRIYGFFFNEITAKEFTNDLGTFRGGYVPAIADADLTVDQTAREDKNMLEGFNNSYVFPTTGKGFTNSRVENYHAPLSLDMNKITGHMNHVLRFVYIEPSIKEVGKLLLDKKLLAAIGKVDPKIVGDALIPWLQRTAAQRLVTKGATGLSDKIFSGIRRNSSLQFMAMNVANWFQNTTGLFPVLTRVDSGFVMGSFKDYLLNPKDFKESIIEKSDYMKTRTSETARELAKHYSEVVLETTKYEKVKDAATDFAFFGEKVSNALIESVAWNAAYRSYITKGESDIEAVKFADATVRQALVDNSAAGSSYFQSGTPFMRLFTMFSGYFFNTGNLALSEWQVSKQLGLTTKAGGSRASWSYLMIIMAPAVVGALIMRAFAGKGLDGDDDGEYFDDIMDILFYSQLRFATAMVPGGTIANTAMAQFNDKAYDDRINLSPAVSTVEQSLHSLSSVPKAIGGNGDPARAIKDSLTALGLASGLPLGVLNKPISYIDKVEKGKVKPNGPVDYTRGLVTGK